MQTVQAATFARNTFRSPAINYAARLATGSVPRDVAGDRVVDNQRLVRKLGRHAMGLWRWYAERRGTNGTTLVSVVEASRALHRTHAPTPAQLKRTERAAARLRAVGLLCPGGWERSRDGSARSRYDERGGVRYAYRYTVTGLPAVPGRLTVSMVPRGVEERLMAVGRGGARAGAGRPKGAPNRKSKRDIKAGVGVFKAGVGNIKGGGAVNITSPVGEVKIPLSGDLNARKFARPIQSPSRGGEAACADPNPATSVGGILVTEELASGVAITAVPAMPHPAAPVAATPAVGRPARRQPPRPAAARPGGSQAPSRPPPRSAPVAPRVELPPVVGFLAAASRVTLDPTLQRGVPPRVVAKVLAPKVPAPPALDPGRPIDELVEYLRRLTAECLELAYRAPCWQLRRPSAHVRRVLEAACEAMTSTGIVPAYWLRFSLDRLEDSPALAGMRDRLKGKPPPLAWLLCSRRIHGQTDWAAHAVEAHFTGARTRRVPAVDELTQRQNDLAFALEHQLDAACEEHGIEDSKVAIAACVLQHLPWTTYYRLLDEIERAGAQGMDDLAARVNAGGWAW